MRVYQLIRVSGGRQTATSGHRTARRKRWDDLDRIMRMVSSAIPIITFRYYPYKQRSWPFGSASSCVCLLDMVGLADVCRISIGWRGRFSGQVAAVALVRAVSWISSDSPARSGTAVLPCSYTLHGRKIRQGRTGLAGICIPGSWVRLWLLLWFPLRFREMRWCSLAILKCMKLWL